MRNQKFYVCELCGNLVGKIDDGIIPMVCCNEEMKRLVPDEKKGKEHLKCFYDGDVLKIMIDNIIYNNDTHLPFVYVETKKGGQRKNVCNDKCLYFKFYDDVPLSVFFYSKNNGLLKVKIDL